MTCEGRMLTIAIAFMCVINTVVGDASTCGEQNIIDDLRQALNQTCTSLNLLKIHYCGKDIECGSEMTKESAEFKPTELFAQDVGKDKRYLLVMVDPDASMSDTESMKCFLHWAVSNMTGADLMNGITSNGTVFKEYMGPSPPNGSHRYQFILFEEPTEGLQIKEISSPRVGFNLEDFIKDNRLCSEKGLFQFNVKAK